MNTEKFVAALETISDEQLESLLAGACLCLVDDVGLAICQEEELSSLDLELASGLAGGQAIRTSLIEAAADLVDQYYRTHPLTEAGFNAQVWKLIDEHGAESITAVAGERSAMTLFVDGGEVVAEMSGSPRHPYGSFLELGVKPASPAEVTDQVRRWLDSGEAYRQYLSMNVCRYNC